MKKLFFVLVITTILSNCTVQQPPYVAGRYVYGYDFRAYSEKGFLFTPYEYKQGEHYVQGIISVELYPTVEKSKFKPTEAEMIEAKSNGFIYQKVVLGAEIQYYKIEALTAVDAIEEAYKTAIDLDANAISDFKITTILMPFENNGFKVTVLKAEGVAIKRK